MEYKRVTFASLIVLIKHTKGKRIITINLNENKIEMFIMLTFLHEHVAMESISRMNIDLFISMVGRRLLLLPN